MNSFFNIEESFIQKSKSKLFNMILKFWFIRKKIIFVKLQRGFDISIFFSNWKFITTLNNFIVHKKWQLFWLQLIDIYLLQKHVLNLNSLDTNKKLQITFCSRNIYKGLYLYLLEISEIYCLSKQDVVTKQILIIYCYQQRKFIINYSCQIQAPLFTHSHIISNFINTMPSSGNDTIKNTVTLSIVIYRRILMLFSFAFVLLLYSYV